MKIETISTKPFEGQKPGTSGLRRKTAVVKQQHYLENFIQCVFDACEPSQLKGGTLLVSGDGRHHNRTAIHTICEMAAAQGVSRVWIGKGGLCSTPAASAIIREREGGVAFGAMVLTASHNPGGPDNDFGVKFNVENGGPAPDKFTDAVYEKTTKITEYRKVTLPPFDIDKIGTVQHFPEFKTEVIDAVEDWLKLMKQIFDFPALKAFSARSDFSLLYDGMHGVAGPYAERIFVTELGLDRQKSLINCEPKEDFGGGHPDPNLTYAKELVKVMHPMEPEKATAATPVLGAAGDGDCDRNMVLGRGFFVTPSDSVAVIAHYAVRAIPYFKDGLKGLSRSMPTSESLDNVAKKLGVSLFETPTGWKYFGNLMDAGRLSICGEESFGTGSDHIREKDGLWAVLAWLSILAHRNKQGGTLVTVAQIVEEFWQEYGRNYYTRYDYEEVPADAANKMMAHIQGLDVKQLQDKAIVKVDSFAYTDPVDGSKAENQGLRLFTESGDRIVFRLSGTGSVGATIRIYIEKRVTDKSKLNMATADVLKGLVADALAVSQLERFTGRSKPTVIT
eukprot:GHVU01039862.1.p1 GENE.GHVU01039862.1~~GHVU01039862.1.p1  ORF type:complete len:562 (+),score=137.01 GHVU01039862.1:307-1992(+)